MMQQCMSRASRNDRPKTYAGGYSDSESAVTMPSVRYT